MAAQLDFKQLNKDALVKLALEKSIKLKLDEINPSIGSAAAEATHPQNPTAATGLTPANTARPKPNASSRRGSFVDNLKEGLESGQSPRKTNTPKGSPLYYAQLTIITPPPHFDLSDTPQNHKEVPSASAPEQQPQSDPDHNNHSRNDKKKNK